MTVPAPEPPPPADDQPEDPPPAPAPPPVDAPPGVTKSDWDEYRQEFALFTAEWREWVQERNAGAPAPDDPPPPPAPDPPAPAPDPPADAPARKPPPADTKPKRRYGARAWWGDSGDGD